MLERVNSPNFSPTKLSRYMVNRSVGIKQVINESASMIVELLAYYITLQQMTNQDTQRHRIVGHPCTNTQGVALCRYRLAGNF